MNKDVVIKVEGISKKYAIGTRESYLTLRDRLMELPRKLFKKEEPKEFWALKNISFEVKRGEVIGIIGRNGAGKSTLLKILARITEPTTGRITKPGRVASMLEVGTGFNPELTGRENIYLNGAILGMSRTEIDSKFNEIIDFSGIEKFIDTPVKHYSSGMYVRLAFAVAAYLDVDILLVDEVLAVGDAEFQKKCIGKMSDLSNSGKTIIFVSHNIESIKNLCSKCLLISDGEKKTYSNTEVVIKDYFATSNKKFSNIINLKNIYRNRSGSGQTKFTQLQYISGSSLNSNKEKHIMSGDKLTIELSYSSIDAHNLNNVDVSIGFDDVMGNRIFLISTEYLHKNLFNLNSEGVIKVTIPRLPLKKGNYYISLFLRINGEITDWIKGEIPLEVSKDNFFGTDKNITDQGNVYVDFSI